MRPTMTHGVAGRANGPRLLENFLCLSVGFALSACEPDAGRATVTIDAGRTYQTILGWEATATLGDDAFSQDVVNSYRDDVLRFAVDSVGLNGLRLTLWSGTESPADLTSSFLADSSTRRAWRATWYRPENDNADPFTIDEAGFQFAWLDHRIEKIVLPTRELLAARGEQLFLNLNYVDFEPSSYEQLADPEEYAELLLATFQHMQAKYSLTPDAVEVLLEPDIGQGWAPEALAAAVVAAGDRLAAHGFHPLFMAPSNTSMTAAVDHYDRMISRPRVREYLSVLSYHRYRDVSMAALTDIRGRVDEHGIRSAMLEHIGSGYQDLHADLGIGNVSLWEQYVLAWPGDDDNGGAYIRVLDLESGRPRLTAGERTRHLSHYFQTTRRGAVRIDASSDNPRIDPLAFVNSDGTYAVVVKTEGRTELTVVGLPAGTYTGRYTTDRGKSGTLGPVAVTGVAPLVASLPGPGVVSLRGGL